MLCLTLKWKNTQDRNTTEGRTDRGVQGDMTIYDEVVDGLDCTDGAFVITETCSVVFRIVGMVSYGGCIFIQTASHDTDTIRHLFHGRNETVRRFHNHMFHDFPSRHSIPDFVIGGRGLGYIKFPVGQSYLRDLR